jgi:hypothetical protein
MSVHYIGYATSPPPPSSGWIKRMCGCPNKGIDRSISGLYMCVYIFYPWLNIWTMCVCVYKAFSPSSTLFVPLSICTYNPSIKRRKKKKKRITLYRSSCFWRDVNGHRISFSFSSGIVKFHMFPVAMSSWIFYIEYSVGCDLPTIFSKLIKEDA